MAKLVTFEVADLPWAPALGLSFDFTDSGNFYGTRAGVPRAPPAVTDPGANGQYQFQPSDADEAIGCVWFITTGHFPARVGGAIHTDVAPFLAAIFTNADGSLTSGSDLPTLDYQTLAGASATPPAVVGVDIGTGEKPIFCFSPTAPDITAGRKFVLTAFTGMVPPAYEGNVQAIGIVVDNIPPVVTLVAGPLTPTDPIHFTATDNILLRRVVVIAKFIEAGFWEVIHDGTNFGPGYEGGSRTALPSGFEYIVTRRAGWPSGSLQLEVIAGDTSGNEA